MFLLPTCVCCCDGCFSAFGYTISSGEVVAGPIYTFITEITDVGSPLTQAGLTRSRVQGGGSFGGIFNNRVGADAFYVLSATCYANEFDTVGTPRSETYRSLSSNLYMEFAIVCTGGQISLSATLDYSVGNFQLLLTGPCSRYNGNFINSELSGELYLGAARFFRQINSYILPTECFNGARTFAGRAASVTVSNESVLVDIGDESLVVPWNAEVVSNDLKYAEYSGPVSGFKSNSMSSVSTENARNLMHDIPAKTWDIVDLTL